ncbi:hypothetical protein KGF57_005144 [Candida theae]|uniref:Uncharacterized protein n=1 Tax=Candida theae TaxID=1198502 RepID=A0AAD5FWC6_9ASCO|nr:uncharacterized protein KGF57_005144 [Candida theae]KAI5948746.1 hypothetical protein KGF57_005144 [Candida theae]
MSTPSTPVVASAVLHNNDAATLPDALRSGSSNNNNNNNNNTSIPIASNDSNSTKSIRKSHDYSQTNLDKPSTPSPPNRKRVSASFLKTPEQPKDASKRYSASSTATTSLPYTPSYKRTSTGSYKSPDGRLVYHNVNSPFSAAHLLKTPRHSAIEDSPTGEEDEDGRRLKMMKTPQYLGNTAKKLFQGDDGSPNGGGNKRDDLTEISSQLRSKLSSALGKLQKDDSSHNSKISFTELSFDSQTSPTRKHTPKRHSALGNNWVPTNTLQRANLNLQTLQQSPIAKSTNSSPRLEQTGFRSNTNSPLKTSPILKGDNRKSWSRLNDMPSPDEETSAHSALLAALSRQRRKSRSSFSNTDAKRNSITAEGPPALQITTAQKEIKLPPLNVALNGEYNNSQIKGFPGKDNEQDAVISLMSLASPQSAKYAHSRSQSLNSNGNFPSNGPITASAAAVAAATGATSSGPFGDNVASPISSRSSSVHIASPTFATMQQPPHLPPLTRFMKSPEAKQRGSRKGLVFATDDTDDEDVVVGGGGGEDDGDDSDRTVEEDK